MVEYLIILFLSLVNCFIGFVLECIDGNIVHLKNGREPNAGACIFPAIPFLPAFWLLAMWGINRTTELSSLWLISVCLISLMLFKAVSIFLGNREINKLSNNV
jgi:hypothetical protein